MEGDRKLCADFEAVKEVVTAIRAVRSQKNIAPREALTLEVLNANPFAAFDAPMMKMANLSDINVVTEKSKGSVSFLVGTNEYAVPLGSLIDVEAERKKLQAELERIEGFQASVEKKLANERFVQNAPAAVVEMERKKLADAQQKIASLRESLANL